MALQGAQTTQVGSRPSRHGLDTTAARGIVGRLGDADDDDMPGTGDDMPGFGWASLINTTDQPSPPAIDWASLGQSKFDLPGTCVGTSRRRPATQLVINLDTLGRSDITMPGDDADMEMEVTTSHMVTAGGMSVGGRPPKKKKLQPSKARAARRLALRGALKK